MSESTPAMWIFFILLVLILLKIDLGVFHKENREIGVKESIYTSLGYLLIGLLFGLGIWFLEGAQKGAEYLTGFAIEKSLALDNIFLISLIFKYFAIPRIYQYRVLFWGIVGVIILRAIMIGIGASIVAQFAWVLYIFAILLIATGIKMFFMIHHKPDIKSNPIINIVQRYFNVTKEIHKEHFFVKIAPAGSSIKKWHITPLFMALILIEVMDLIFAIDSVPAILAISTDTFIVYTSNIFAILGLRALYFCLDALLVRFKYLKYSLAILLIFIGSKIFIAHLLGLEKFPPLLALAITFGILASGVAYSFYKTRVIA